MPNRVAISLALRDTEACLEALSEFKESVGLAEICLDLMDSFDLPKLIGESPVPLVIVCRPPREGGNFGGSEAERIDILGQAMGLGCAYVDVEWDSVSSVRERRRSDTKLIASRHWFDRMPATLWPEFESLRQDADVVKLVGHAEDVSDNLPVLELLRRADKPVVAFAMGEAGRLTRLISPCFENCLLTYGVRKETETNAPGQLTIAEMNETYHLNAAGPTTSVHVHLCAGADSAAGIRERNIPGEALHIPLVVSVDETRAIVPGLLESVPRLSLTADDTLQSSLDSVRTISGRTATIA